MSATFLAQWPTECAACGWRIVRDTLARYDDRDNVVHAVCPEGGDLRPVGEVCGVCFMEKSTTGRCECDD